MNNIFLSNSDLHGLDKIKIGFLHDTVFFPNDYSKKTFHPLEEIIHHAIEHLVCGRSKNLLSFGYKLMSERAKGRLILGSQLVQTSFNSFSIFFKSKPWEQLHAIVGDDLLFFLLTKCYLFLSVKNGCYIQLCGIPLYELDFCECKCLNSKVPADHLQQQHHLQQHESHQAIVAIIGKAKTQKRKIVSVISNSKKIKLKNDLCEPLNFNKKTLKKNSIWLQRSRMFYSKVFIEYLHQKFIMNAVQPSNSGVYTLMKAVFQFSNGENFKRIPNYLRGFKSSFKEMILNFKSLNIRKLLACYCPLPQWYKNGKANIINTTFPALVTFNEKVRYKFAVQSFVPEHKVGFT